MLLLSMTLSFVSCGKIGYLDLDKVAERLEDEDYLVEAVTNEYYVYYALNVMFPYVELDERPEEVLSALPKNEGNDVFYALRFEDADIAKEAYAVLEPEIEYFVEEYNENLEKEDEDTKSFTWARKGDVVYFGTVDAVKDALGMPASLFVFGK